MSEQVKKEQENIADTVLGNKGADKKPFNRGAKRPDRKPREEAIPSEYTSKTIDVNRITKVTKGGRTLRFAAIVVIGNKNGKVGFGTGKAKEVTEAIKKAEQMAKRNVVEISIVGTTVPHETIGRFGTCRVLLMPSSEGNGIIAGGAARIVLELAGYKDVTAKIHGSTNKGNVVRATLSGITSMRTKEQIAALRGLSVEQV